MSNFKETLNILSTSFEMKGNLPTKEPIIQKEWLDKKIYQKVLNKNRTAEQKILHDGPPYANGSIHVGHALNKILKDIVIRRWNMEGYYSEYIPGWDTHGMPIEHALIKKGINTDKNLSITQKRENCKNFALEQVKVQKTQFSRLGLLTDMSKYYMTLEPEFEARQLNVFIKALEKKLIYQDLKPVYWSWSSQTALAEAEVEYADVRTASIYVSFEVVEGNQFISNGSKLIIWTTTPWTIPSNLAIATHPGLEYSNVKVGNEIYVVASSRMVAIANKLEWNDYQVISTFKGSQIEGIKYRHPLYDVVSPVILADYVSDGDGTGLVHNAPGFGQDDYLACKKYGIKPYAPIDAYGKFDNTIIDKDLVGIFYDEANKIITEKLAAANSLLKLEFFSHSVAHDWRTKKPVMYRATKQWFINIGQLKDEMLDAIKDVWFPSNINKLQLSDMIKNRTEWCISRQRYWGVPIPIIYDKNDSPIFDKELIQNIVNIFKNESSNIWFEKPVEYFLTTKYQDGSAYRKEKDIMDVWFDSGTTFTLLEANNLQYPAELYLEGKDQFRGWFNSSLINSVIYSGQAPYKKLLGCGFVLDEQGRKMSKSIGNVVDPNKVCEKFGADILRMWVASSNYRDDIRIGDNILTQVSETYRRVRNTLFKFILSNISDFDYKVNKQNKFSEPDLLILGQLRENVKKINAFYDEFNFIEVIETINNHVVELSSWYFDIIKDSLYCDDANNDNRRTVQTVLYTILKSYLAVLAPIIPHTAEEVYTNFNIADKKESVFLENWIDDFDLEFAKVNEKKWKQFSNLRSIAYAKLEKLRAEKIINKNNQALVEIEFNNEFNFTQEELAKYFNVAKVIIKNSSSDTVNVEVANANMVRCERCWNYFEAGEINQEQLCERCAKAIKKI